MNAVTYNIPAHLFDSYHGRRLIVRSDNPSDFVSYLSQANLENVLYAQLTSVKAELDPLLTWTSALPVDVLLRNPAAEYPFLYNFSRLLDKRPVRISISVEKGFAKAVRLALALSFSVKLDVGQPDTSLMPEMDEVLDLYLHGSEISQPVEYFHSTFLLFFHGKQSPNLWFVQEEDPEQFRFVTNEGTERVSPRFGQIDWKDLEPILAAQRMESTFNTKTECDRCEFLAPCGGYFKWPNNEFDCEGVKHSFSRLKVAAEELRTDVACFRKQRRGRRA